MQIGKLFSTGNHLYIANAAYTTNRRSALQQAVSYTHLTLPTIYSV